MVIEYPYIEWAGLSLRVYKDGYQVGLVTRIDSDRGSVFRAWYPFLDIPAEEQGRRVKVIPGGSTLVDGVAWKPDLKRVVEIKYDEVHVVGSSTDLAKYANQIPKKWLRLPIDLPHSNPI